MGYVEDIQKINNLAKELIKHGRATSLDEAVVEAKKMLGSNIELARIPNPGQDYNRVERPNAESQTLQTHERKLREAEEKKEPGMTWQEAMSKNNEYMVGMMKKFESTISMFQNEISILKKEIYQLRDGQKVINVVKDASDTAPQPVQQQPKSQQQSFHPKTGSSDPGEFSVEKIFYCGNK